MNPKRIWLNLSIAARRRLCEELAALWDRSHIRDFAADGIARALKFRTTTVQRAEPERISNWLLQAFPRIAPEVGTNLLVAPHWEGNRAELLSEVYQALGVDHEGPQLAAGAQEEELDPTRSIPAILGLVGRYELDDLWLCFAVMEERCPEKWLPAVSAVEQLLAARRIASQASALAEAPGDDPIDAAAEHEETATSGEPEQLSMPHFTTLDRALIRSVVGALNHVQGSFTFDQLDDLVQEVVELSDARPQSHFHRGFVDAMLAREIGQRGAGDNDERRAWYLVGHVLGSLRRLPEEPVLDCVKTLGITDRRALLDPRIDAGAMLAPELISRFLGSGDLGEVEVWIRAHGTRIAPQIAPRVMDWANETLLDADGPARVRALLDLLSEQLHSLASNPDLAPLPTLLRAVERRRAVALRSEGRHVEALHVLARLLTETTDASERSRLLAQKALVEMGVRSLEALGLPAGEALRRTFLETLERSRPTLEAAAEGTDPSPIALVSLALPAVANALVAESDRATAADRLHAALSAMSSKPEPIWERSGLAARARFYSVLLDLRSPDPGAARAVVDRLQALLEEGAELPPDLALDAVTDATLLDAPRIAEMASLALRRFSHRALRTLDLRALAERSIGFRRALIETLEPEASVLTSPERWDAWHAVLEGSLGAEQRDIEGAGRALDALEGIAESSPNLGERFLELLERSRLWEPTWEESDRDEARLRLYKAHGRLDEARAVLFDLTQQTITTGSLEEADELIAQLQLLGADGATLDPLRRRLATERAEPAGPREPPARLLGGVTILFVGGNEVQEGYIPALRDAIAGPYPSVNVDFETPGWSSNWGRIVERLSGRLQRADAVVLMRFVRTQLGRTVRRLASQYDKPWIACSGHGRDSMQRAILRAIEVVQQQQASRGGELR